METFANCIPTDYQQRVLEMVLEERRLGKMGGQANDVGNSGSSEVASASIAVAAPC